MFNDIVLKPSVSPSKYPEYSKSAFIMIVTVIG